jgi:hypothetical protein
MGPRPGTRLRASKKQRNTDKARTRVEQAPPVASPADRGGAGLRPVDGMRHRDRRLLGHRLLRGHGNVRRRPGLPEAAKEFTSKDVKFSFDRRLKINDRPRRLRDHVPHARQGRDTGREHRVVRLNTSNATFPSELASGAGSIVDHTSTPPTDSARTARRSAPARTHSTRTARTRWSSPSATTTRAPGRHRRQGETDPLVHPGVYVKGWVPDYPDADNFTAPAPQTRRGRPFLTGAPSPLVPVSTARRAAPIRSRTRTPRPVPGRAGPTW